MSWDRGMFMGACDEVGRIRRDANANMRAAQAIIDRKDMELAEWREAHAAWKARAKDLEAEVARLVPLASRAASAESKVASLSRTVTELTCLRAGDEAAAEALYWALNGVAPQHALFVGAGTCPDGRSASAIDKITIDAANAKACELGVPAFAGPVTSG